MPDFVYTNGSERIAEIPSLRRFAGEMEARLSESPDSFWNCQPAFEELLCTESSADCLNYELEQIRLNERYRPERISIYSIPLIECAQYSLTINFISPEEASSIVAISSLEHRMLAYITDGPVRVEPFEQPRPEPHDVFDVERRLIRHPVYDLKPREILRVRAARDIRNLRTDRPQFGFCLSSAKVVRYRWVYTLGDLKPLRVANPDSVASKLEFSALAISEIGDRASLPGLCRLLEHKDHFVRWAALKAITVISPADGLNHVNRALVSDPHAHVRAGAASFLKVIADVKTALATSQKTD